MVAKAKKMRTRPRKLLLLDDNPIDLETIEYLLKKANKDGFRCQMARSGGEALDLCRSQGFDCILLDINLPDMTGLEFLRELNVRGMDIPCIILSGMDCKTSEDEAIRAGAYAHLVKGNVTPADLERTIRYSLEKAGTFRRLRSAEHQAKTVNLVKSDFVLRVSSEVVKSIQNINWTAGLLLEKDPQRLSYEQMSYLKRIQTESQSLSRQVTALFELVKIHASVVEVHLPSFLRDLVKAHQPLAKVNGLSLDLSLNNEVPEILLSDPDILSQVVKTSLGYLLTFPRPGRVRVRAESDKMEQEVGGYPQVVPVTVFHLSYRGAGQGGDAPLEFPFQEGSARRSKKGNVEDTSLTIMGELARLLGGELKVESVADVGLDVYFFLPRQAGASV